ncbi:MAG: hypothetical protein HRU09_06375, partial [Oligoflexales bacterium]|nr:hypothetical protein [Oligoflexales bacterium]
MLTYYNRFIKFGLLASKPESVLELEWWAFFACFHHLAWNANHPAFSPPLSLWEVILDRKLGTLVTLLIRCLCFFLFFPFLLLLPWLAICMGSEAKGLLFSSPISFFDRYVKSQLDQTPLGLLNSILDLTHLVHNPGSIQLVSKAGFESRCRKLGLPCIESYTSNSVLNIGDKVWCKPKWGGNGEGHYIATINQEWLEHFHTLSKDYLVQPILSNHQELQKLTPSLASVRLVTIKNKAGEISLFWAGELKAGQEGSINSNTSTGGYNLILSDAGKVLKVAYFFNPDSEELVFDANVDFSEFKVPFIGDRDNKTIIKNGTLLNCFPFKLE